MVEPRGGTTDAGLALLDAEGMQHFDVLHAQAIGVVTERFYALQSPVYQQSGARGREACREDLAFHLEFLRPALEFGLLRPMVEYLRWLSSVLTARAIPIDHVALSLDLLGEFFLQRMNTADGATVSTALRAARTQFLAAHEVPTSRPWPSDAWPEAVPFETALLGGSQHEAMAVVNGCIDAGHGLVEIERSVIMPSLYGIGEKWQANHITVAREHMATAIAQSVMTVGLLRAPPPPIIGKRVLLACIAHNEHSLGLRMVADAFQLAGWEVQYLGANVPSLAIIRQAEEWSADLVGLSVSFPQQLPAVRQVIAQLSERHGSNRPAVIIGGLAINRFDRLADMAGADAYGADAPTAVLRANQIIAARPRSA
jgi:methylmalonyl-CoA mutase cobalamin-binding domain/chain